MPFPKSETAKWSEGTDQEVGKYLEGRDKVLDMAAARGFPAPSGGALTELLSLSQDTKAKLVDINGKIYDEQYKLIYDVLEFNLKIGLRVARLQMEYYKETIFNAVALETSQQEAAIERESADIHRFLAKIEKRQAFIIQAKAQVEQQINIYRQQLVDAGYTALPMERAVAQAQIAAAEAKVQILDSVFQLVTAEQLVVVAEQKRATILKDVVVIAQAVAEAKKGLIPLYLQEASAKLILAAAISEDAQIKKLIAGLGWDKLDVKIAEEDAVHEEKVAQFADEMAKESKVKAAAAVEIFRVQMRRLLLEYANAIKGQILALRQQLEEDQIFYHCQLALDRKQVELDNEKALLTMQEDHIARESVERLLDLELATQDQVVSVKASAKQIYHSETTEALSLTIIKGSLNP